MDIRDLVSKIMQMSLSDDIDYVCDLYCSVQEEITQRYKDNIQRITKSKKG